jgi:hypothetical protein
MNWQRGKAIIISGGVCLVLAGLAVFLMVKFGGALSQAKKGLRDADDDIRTLSAERVYPDAGNLKLVKANTEGLAKFRDSQVDRLRARQLKPLSMTPTDFIDDVKARFKALRTKSLGVLQAAAERDKVGDEALKVESAMDSTFFGSFERYGDEGFPPGEEDIPRLTVQLQTIDQLCDILVRNEVKAILSLVRDRFDGDSRAPGARISGPSSPYRVTYGGDEAPSPLKWRGENSWVEGEHPTAKPLTIESEYYTVAFLASEQVTWRVLLDLANSETLYAIMRVRFENENAGMQTTDMNINTGGGGGSLAELLNRHQRKTQAQAPLEGATRPGWELVRSEIHLKVTRFPEPAVLQGAGDDKAPEGGDPPEGEEP